MREVKRVINLRYIFIVCSLLFINALILLSVSDRDVKTQSVYNELLYMTKNNENVELTYREKVLEAWKKYVDINDITGNTITEEQRNARQTLMEDAKYVDQYKEGIQTQINDARNQFSSVIYQKMSYEKINLYKTMIDLEDVKDLDVQLSNGKWLIKLYDYQYIQIFTIALLFYIIYHFFDEKKTGLYHIIHAGRRGRLHLCMKRISLVVGASFFVNLLFFIESAGILLYHYGGIGDLDIAAASDSVFQLTASSMTRVQFLLFMVLISAILEISLALLFWFILNLFNNVNVGLFFYIVLFAIDILVYYLVSSKNVIRFLHYINLIYFIFPRKTISYNNWGYSIGVASVLESTLVAAFIIVIFATLFNMKFSVKGYGDRKNNILERMLQRLQVQFHKLFCKTSGLIMELYKVLVSQKNGIILCVLIIAALRVEIGSGVLYDPVKFYVSQYYEMAEGRTYSSELEEIYGHFEGEYEEFLKSVDYSTGMAEMQIQNQKIILANIRDSIDYVKEKNEAGINAVVLKPYEYESAFGEGQKSNQEYLALLGSLCVIFITSGFLSYEKKNRIDKLAIAYKERRKWLLKKFVINMILICVVEGVLYGSYYYKLFHVFQLNNLNAPAYSLKMFSGLIINLTIGQLLVLDLVMKYFSFILLSAIICLVSMYTKYTYSMIVSVLFMIPHMLYMLGYESFYKFSYVRYVTFFPLIYDSMSVNQTIIMFFCILSVFGIFSFYHVMKLRQKGS